jgi:SAM-dependent methyltransferase
VQAVGLKDNIFRTVLAVGQPLHPFDAEYHVNTSGFIPGSDLVTGHPHDRYNTAYYAMSPSRFRHAVLRWIRETAVRPVEQYTFVDLGSGKGRAVLLASGFPFLQVIGVELHPHLTRIAAANVERWVADGRSIAPINLHCQDAIRFLFPSGPCLLYLFHPFTVPVVEHLLGSLAHQFRDLAGFVDILYFNPEAAEQIEAHGGFTHLWTETLLLSEEDQTSDPFANSGDRCSCYRWTGLPDSLG